MSAWRPTWPRRISLWFRYIWPVRTIYNLISLTRYLVTGYCGYGGCGYATFYRYDTGERVRPFVPEAGCPIHDSNLRFSQWIRKLRKGREQSPWRLEEEI